MFGITYCNPLTFPVSDSDGARCASTTPLTSQDVGARPCTDAITIISLITYLVKGGLQCYSDYTEVGLMPSEKPFLSFIISEELLEKIDDFRFEHRFESRAEAIRELIRWALENYAAY